MKHYFLSIPILAMLIFLSCKKDPVSPVTTGFFPMEVGNIWHYESHPNSFSHAEMTVEIVGTRVIDDNTYFIFETTYPGTDQSDERYFRLGENGKIFINWQGEEFLYIDFNRDIKDAWYSWEDYVGVLQEKEKTLEVPAGRFTNTTQVFFDIGMIADEEFCETYANGVGKLDISCVFGIPMQLTAAKISGVTISN